MLCRLSERIEQLGYTLDAPRAYPRQAAVLIALTREAEPRVLLTLRSGALKRHSGEVAFPGGWFDDTDESLATTALREAEEELGIRASQVELLGPWRSRYARGGIRVQPMVGLIEPGLRFNPNPGEIDAVFSVPLSYLLSDPRTRTDLFEDMGEERWIPAYDFEGYEIWGFTAGVLVDLLNKGLDAGIGRSHPVAPERRFFRPSQTIEE